MLLDRCVAVASSPLPTVAAASSTSMAVGAAALRGHRGQNSNLDPNSQLGFNNGPH